MSALLEKLNIFFQDINHESIEKIKENLTAEELEIFEKILDDMRHKNKIKQEISEFINKKDYYYPYVSMSLMELGVLTCIMMDIKKDDFFMMCEKLYEVSESQHNDFLKAEKNKCH